MAQPAKNIDDDEQALVERIMTFVHDPLGYVLYAFPWGDLGSPIYEPDGAGGPDVWQRDILETIGRGTYELDTALQIAVASGHKIGKSCLVAWIVLWFLSTRVNPHVVVTANTGTQLTNKTWREVAKWLNLAINKHWFKLTTEKLYAIDSKEQWFAEATTWSIDKPEAFAGTHEERIGSDIGYVLYIFDEASHIPPIIWENASGAMQDRGAIWLVFGNPTRNSGRFKECFTKRKKNWITRQIDSREAKIANQAEIAKQIEEEGGEDVDVIRVRIRGIFPSQSTWQLFGEDVIQAAIKRNTDKLYTIHDYEYAPIIIGVDIARSQTGNQSVILVRQGLIIREIRKYRGLKTNALVTEIAKAEDAYNADNVFIDIGYNPGVYDNLIQVGRAPIQIAFGSAPGNRIRYANKRAEMYFDTLQWLENGGAIPDDRELLANLREVEYSFMGRTDRIKIMSKEDMIAMGLESLDTLDALVLTFAIPVKKYVSEYDEDYDYSDTSRRRVAASGRRGY